MKLTADLIQQSPQYRNATKERELYLRGYRINVIENMGATLDQFDAFDMCDNDIRRLDGFPLLKRLCTLLLCNNRISSISEDIATQLPNLNYLILTNNNISELAEIHPLRKLPNLTHLSLLRNPVTSRKVYRSYVVYMLPRLRVLDFQRVTPTERENARKQFSSSAGLEIRKKILTRTLNDSEISKTGNDFIGEDSSFKDIESIREAIRNTNSLVEIQRLEALLRARTNSARH